MSISSTSRIPSLSSIPPAYAYDNNSAISSTPTKSNINNASGRYPHLESTSDIQLTRTATGSSSIHSATTQATSFDGNWLPESQVVPQSKKRISLVLSPFEISALRKSWNEVITGKKTRLHHNHHSNQIPIQSQNQTQNRSPTKPNKSLPATPNSKLNNNVQSITLPNATASSTFTSSLFCVQFYQNLISMMPQIEKLIPSIKHQASAFAGVINIAMSTLEDLSRMNDSLDSLGRLHSRILGIDSPYFEVMGNALIKTFRDRYQSDRTVFELPLEEAWIKLYCFLANSILQGGIDPIIEYGTKASDLSSTASFKDFSSLSLNENETASATTSSTSSSNVSSSSSSQEIKSAFKVSKDTIPIVPVPARPSNYAIDSKRDSSIFYSKSGLSSIPRTASDSFTDKMKTSSIKKLRRGAKGDPDDPNCIIM